jgi:hypothetical protein
MEEMIAAGGYVLCNPGRLRALAPSLFGVSGWAMPRRGRRFNRYSRDHHRRLGHCHVGWRDRTSGDEPQPDHEHGDFDEHWVFLL